MKTRKRIIIPLTIVGAAAAGGVAWAILSGTVIVPDSVAGVATGGGSNACQTSGVTFTLPDPAWSNTEGAYVISQINFSGVEQTCAVLGTAVLDLNITDANSSTSISDGTATGIGTTGNITISPAIRFDIAAEADYYYLVSNQ